MFLIYINDLAENLSSHPKRFANGTALFSVVYDLNITTNKTNDNLKKIEAWAHQCKMNFIPGPLKQAQEVISSQKRNKPHLGMFVDIKLDFDEHTKGVFKSISLTLKL